MTGNIPNHSQEARVLATLREANGGWINKQVFSRQMMMTQAGRAIWNLENDPKWTRQYEGMRIEHSDFKDEYGFKSYRLIPNEQHPPIIANTSREPAENEAVHTRGLFETLRAV